VSKETYYSVKRDLSKETYYSVKRDLLQCQKRPTTVSKETYYKRDLLAAFDGELVKLSQIVDEHVEVAQLV